MLVTFLDAYLEDLKIEAKRKIASRKLSGRGPDLPLNFHPAAVRASAVDAPCGAV
jgi:hypothetical protein